MKSKQYRAEVKTRAVELLIESQKDYPSLWAAIQAIAPKFGCTPETLRSWHKKHLARQNPVIVTTQSQAARIAELERENRELKQAKQANEIIRKAAGIEAQAERGRPHKSCSTSSMMKKKNMGPFRFVEYCQLPHLATIASKMNKSFPNRYSFYLVKTECPFINLTTLSLLSTKP